MINEICKIQNKNMHVNFRVQEIACKAIYEIIREKFYNLKRFLENNVVTIQLPSRREIHCSSRREIHCSSLSYGDGFKKRYYDKG